MKRRFLIFLITLLCILSLSAALCGCSKNGGASPAPATDVTDDGSGGGDSDGSDGDSGSTGDGDSSSEALEVYVKIGTSVVTAQKSSASGSGGADVYTATVTLAVGDSVTVYDSKGVTYRNYGSPDFDGVAEVGGSYTFEIRIDGSGGTISVTVPKPVTPIKPDLPIKDTKTTVYYTNSNKWSKVYAYLWNNATGVEKTAWPGNEPKFVGTSGYSEDQYSIEVDYSKYDRIIFNNGSDQKTRNLVVSAAVSGYYGEDGTFTMGTDNYGKVKYVTLPDSKNLSYIDGAKKEKKVSVYTPPGYSTSKKYGVLYMFDSQNLYAAAEDADKPNNSWAADVAVTNLVKNGGDGVIIVAIDNTDGYRDRELTMSSDFGTLTDLAYNNDFRRGTLDQLGNFIKETLMPWVKSNYSVDDSREKTGIAGSSSGGLAAYYLGLRDNDLYGYIGALSPANGLFESKDWENFYAKKNFGANKPEIYVYCGMNNKDEDELRPAAREIKTLLTKSGYDGSKITEYYADGEHNETYWRIAFMEFLGIMA